jgi:hypothetical protein
MLELRYICQVSSNYTAIGMCGRKMVKFSSGSSYNNTKSTESHEHEGRRGELFNLFHKVSSGSDHHFAFH